MLRGRVGGPVSGGLKGAEDLGRRIRRLGHPGGRLPYCVHLGSGRLHVPVEGCFLAGSGGARGIQRTADPVRDVSQRGHVIAKHRGVLPESLLAAGRRLGNLARRGTEHAELILAAAARVSHAFRGTRLGLLDRLGQVASLREQWGDGRR